MLSASFLPSYARRKRALEGVPHADGQTSARTFRKLMIKNVQEQKIACHPMKFKSSQTSGASTSLRLNGFGNCRPVSNMLCFMNSGLEQILEMCLACSFPTQNRMEQSSLER